MRRYAIQYMHSGETWTHISAEYFNTQRAAISSFSYICPDGAKIVATFRITTRTAAASDMKLIKDRVSK